MHRSVLLRRIFTGFASVKNYLTTLCAHITVTIKLLQSLIEGNFETQISNAAKKIVMNSPSLASGNRSKNRI